MDYPSVPKRYFAAVIDGLVILTLFFIISKSPFSEWSTANPIVFILIVLFYEPLFTAWFCTLGQFLMAYRVRTFETRKRINIFQSILRYLVKIPLGIVSMLTIPARSDRRAIHDLASKTIVINHNN